MPIEVVLHFSFLLFIQVRTSLPMRLTLNQQNLTRFQGLEIFFPYII